MNYLFNIIKKSFWITTLFIMVFAYVFSFNLIICPIPTRLIIAIFSLLLILINNKKIKINSQIFLIFLLLVDILTAMFASLVNNFIEFEYIKIIINILCCFFSLKLIKSIWKKALRFFDFNTISLVLAIIGDLQCIIMLLRFNNVFFNQLIKSIFIFNEGTDKSISVGTRLIGIGCQYFGGGVIFAVLIAIIACAIMLEKDMLKRSFLLISWFFMGLVAPFLAKTAFIGHLASFVIWGYFLLQRKETKTVLFIFSLLFVFITNMLYFLLPMQFKFSERVLESVNDPKREIEFYSGTSKNTMWRLPTSLKTWLIGDGKLRDLNQNAYYMHTDFGFCRLIFYYGIIGTFVHTLFFIALIMIIVKRNSGINYYAFLISAMFILFNIKGISNGALPILSLFLISEKSCDDEKKYLNNNLCCGQKNLYRSLSII